MNVNPPYQNRIPKFNLRAKITLGIVLPLVLILGIFSVIEYFHHQRVSLAELSLIASQSNQVIKDSLQNDMLSRNLDSLQNTLHTIGGSDVIRAVYLLDASGRIVFSSHDEAAEFDTNDLSCKECHLLPPSERPASMVVTLSSGQRILRSMSAIENRPECNLCHDPEQEMLGLLLIDTKTDLMEAKLAADLRRSILWWVGTILITAIIVNLVLSRLVLKRLEGLAHALTIFGRERLDLRLQGGEADEIGQLDSAFNAMGQRIEVELADNRALTEQLRNQSEQRGKLLKRLITVEEDERRSMARELHDEIGQILGGLSLQLGAIEKFISIDPDRALQHIKQNQEFLSSAADRMHDIILTLRPSELDDLGLVPALRVHAERFLKDSDINFDFDVQDLALTLRPEIKTAFFRIFQEALSNVVRHARATHVHVSLACIDGVFIGKIEDNGRGFTLAKNSIHTNRYDLRGLGLLGMEERAAQCNGSLEIKTNPGEGTRICVIIPLNEVSHD